MDKKLHIKAVAGHNVKIDANWYSYGDNFDCYLTPNEFKDYVKGFLDFDIILEEDNSPKSIDAEYKIIEKEQSEVKEDVIPKSINNEVKDSKQSKKKTRV